MALVILPCDLPHWPSMQAHLTKLSNFTGDANTLAEIMYSIFYISNSATGLDPEESEKPERNLFSGFVTYLEELKREEREHIMMGVIPAMARRALELKMLKPVNGMQYSLQQHSDKAEYKRCFLASLLANAFFSTFPRRTVKTHPTLLDFNFTFFFQFLDLPCQKAKLESFLHYFDLLETQNEDEIVTISRQVMNGKEWFTIDDWMESSIPLCNLLVRHDGRLEDVETQCLNVSFCSEHVGGDVLQEGSSKESVDFTTMPELLCLLSSVEALEDNEAILVRDIYKVGIINDPRHDATFSKFPQPLKTISCCIDAEKYTRLPLGQLAEDNLLRELNKALVGFRQGLPAVAKPMPPTPQRPVFQRRLSPIGESFSSTPKENKSFKEESPPRKIDSPARRAAWLKPPSSPANDEASRRGRFIVLGSSGECLPVNRPTTFLAGKREVMRSVEETLPRRSNADSMFSSAQSEDDGDDEVFHSARTSLDLEEIKRDEFSRSDEGYPQPNTIDNDLERLSFADRLREALSRGATTYSSQSSDSSYAVGISVTGSSKDFEYNVRCRRGTSTGFLLESLDDGFCQDSPEKENGHTKSDDYSFSTDSSDIEEMYGELTRWLVRAQHDQFDDVPQERVVSALHRALSDPAGLLTKSPLKSKLVTAARSLSLEMVKKNPKLASHMFSLLSGRGELAEKLLPSAEGMIPVATGNWGCGSSCGGDHQLKLLLQWLAASVSGTPSLVYYTCRHRKLLKVDTIKRVVTDRQWTVGQLTSALLNFAQAALADTTTQLNLFDYLLSQGHA